MARAAEEHGLTPQEQADRTSERYKETWALLNISHDDFIRTTEPRHHRAVQELLTAAKDNGHIYKDTYEGLYCVACEAYYTEDDLVDGNCPIHGRPVEFLSEENWFFALSAFEQPLLDWYEANPAAVQPEGKRNEALGLIRQGLRDISISRSSIDWGVQVPWDPDHVFYVWYDALINYATAVGYGSDPAAVRRLVARGPPRDRQGHPPLPLRLLARPAPGGRPGAAEAHQRPRLPAGRGREDVQDQPEPDRPGGPGRGLRCRRLPLPLPGRHPLRSGRRLQLRGHGRALQQRPGQQPGQPPVPGGHGRGQEV